MNSEHLSRALAVYQGSDADATRRLYDDLEALGPRGSIAMNLFRACKCSERAKAYRRRAHKDAAYDRKQWSMGMLANALQTHAGALGMSWGWGLDEAQPLHRYVLYVDTPNGQVSFHSEARGIGPVYPGQWDGQRGVAAARVCAFAAAVLEAGQ